MAQLKIPCSSAILCAMELEMTLPDEVPVMTLPNTTFFPQALMPLHIFEPRYRQMIRDVLATNRLFAVAGMNLAQVADSGEFEPPHRVASVGIVRACQKNHDGTSSLLLQGLCRVEIVTILQDQPYRRIRVRALASEAGASAGENEMLRRELARLLKLKSKLAESSSKQMTAFLKGVDDPEAFVDIAAFSLCEDVGLKQRLLETLDVHRRLELFGGRLRVEIEQLKLQRKLQGPLSDQDVPNN